MFSAVFECICYEYACRSKMNFDNRVAYQYVVGWVGGSVTEHLMMRSKVVPHPTPPHPLGCSGLLWAALACSRLLWAGLACSGRSGLLLPADLADPGSLNMVIAMQLLQTMWMLASVSGCRGERRGKMLLIVIIIIIIARAA